MPGDPADPYRDVLYTLDDRDDIVTTGGAWESFAVANGAPTLAAPDFVGQSLWDHVSDAPTREIYRHAFRRVRDRGTALRLPFRCDAPEVRREMQLVISPGDGPGALAILARTLRVVYRAPIALLRHDLERRGDVLRICGWCKAVWAPDLGRWLELEEAAAQVDLFGSGWAPPLSHGICPDCSVAVRRELHALPSG